MRAYRALLHLFPASFRAEYGGEMCALFARRDREAAGVGGRFALWLEAVADVLANAVRVQGDLLRQDLRYTARTLARSPGFALTAIAVSALGVGATTAAFSITDHVLIRPLPFADARRLVKLWQAPTSGSYSRVELSPANYRDWKSQSTSFEGMAAYRSIPANLVGTGDPERLEGAAVTADLFPLLGTPPALGRVFGPDDDREGAPGTVLLSHRLWRDRFGRDPAVLGRKLILDDAPYEVVGVMPAGFHFPSRFAQFWKPMRFQEADFEERDNTYLQVVAKRKREVSLEQARAEMYLIAAQLERAYPKENARVGASVMGLRDEMSRQARLLLAALFGAALCVLLIACTNLASLLLARGLERRKELAVRTALGAGRERLVRQLLTEGLILALGGGVLGVLLAGVARPLVLRLVPHALPITEVPPVDLRVLGFAALVTAVTGIGFAVVPALRALGDADPRGLREASRTAVPGSRERVRSTLVVAEVTVSVVLLVSCGLLIRALWRLQAIDPGFRSQDVLTARTALPLPRYERVAVRQQFYTSVLGDLRALPGVSSAAYISFLPMVGRGGIWGVAIPGRPESLEEPPAASLRFVTPGFFATLGIPVRRGRDLSEADTGEAPRVAVVSESFTREHWPGEDPLGRRFSIAFQERTVVGVVGDIKVRGLETSSEPQVYLPSSQVPDGSIIGYVPKELVVRSSTPLATLLPALRRVVARADPQQPISDVRMLADIVDAETAPRQVQVRVLGSFAAIAILLAGIGIHGLVAFTVSSRAREIGVRLALGAQSRDILDLVLRQGARLSGIAVILGVALAYAAGRAMEALLVGVSPRDAATFLAAVALAVAMTLAGSFLPAMRAVRLNPLTVMRAE